MVVKKEEEDDGSVLRKARTKEEIEADRQRVNQEFKEGKRDEPFRENADFGSELSSKQPEIFRDEFGEATGQVQFPGGRTFLGLNKLDAQKIAQSRHLKPESLEKAERFRAAEGAIQEVGREQTLAGQVEERDAELAEQERAKQSREELFRNTGLTEEEFLEGMQSGAAGSVTASDITDISMFGVGGLITSSVKNAAARMTLKKAGKGYLNKGFKEVKNSVGKLVGVGLLGTVAGGVSSVIASDILTGGASDTQAALNTVGDLGTEVIDSVRNGMTTISQGREDIETLEQELALLETKLQQEGIQRFVLSKSGQLVDIRQDINERKLKLRNAKNDLLTIQIEEPDVVELGLFVNELRKKYGAKRRSVKDIVKESEND